MKKVEAISIDGKEIPDEVADELDEFDISTHYSNGAITATKSMTPLLHAFLVEKGMITEDEDKVICCIWGT